MRAATLPNLSGAAIGARESPTFVPGGTPLIAQKHVVALI